MSSPPAISATVRRRIQRGETVGPMPLHGDAGAPFPQIVAITMLFVFTVAAFAPGLGGQLLSWDDNVLLIGNPNVHALTWENFRAWFTRPINGTYIPLIEAGFALEFAAFGLNPFPYHLTNVLLHALNAVLAAVLFRRLGLGLPAAALGAAFFALHPARVEAVAWVTSRKDVQYTAFLLGALLAWVSHREAPSPWKYALAFLLAAAAAGSKGKAMVAPVLLFAIELYLGRGRDGRLWLLLAPFAALAAATAGIALWAQKEVAEVATQALYAPLQRVVLVGVTIFTYLRLTVLPFAPYGAQPLYAHPGTISDLPGETTLPGSWWFIAAATYGAVAAAAWFLPKRPRVLAFLLLIVAPLLPVLQFFPVAGSAVAADRYTYLPGVWLGLLLGLGLEHAGRHRVPAFAGTAVVLALLAWGTVRALPQWTSTLSLYTAIRDAEPTRSLGYWGRGTELLDRGRVDEAIAELEKAVALAPRDTRSRAVLGAAYGLKRRDADARRVLVEALALDPRSTEALGNLLKLEEQAGNHPACLALLDVLIPLEDTAPLRLQRATLRANLGDPPGAEEDVTQAVTKDPSLVDAWMVRAFLRANLGRIAEAKADAREYLSRGGAPNEQVQRLLALPEG